MSRGERRTSNVRGATGHDERQRVHALGDATLVAAMRADDAWAWGEFVVRFTSPLESYARALRIPESDWDVCITEVIENEAMRLAAPGQQVPERLASYLVRAVRNRWLRLKRSRLCRERYYLRVAEGVERVVLTASSESAVRDSYGPAEEPEALSAAREKILAALRRELTHDEEMILGWAAQAIPHRQIAEWMGMSYDAATKRIWRLCRRLRVRLAAHIAALPPEEQRDALRIVPLAVAVPNVEGDSK